MYVHRGQRLIYLAHPRTASRATAEALQSIGFEPSGKHHDCAPEGEFPGFTRFTTVRNPWDAAISWVFFRRKGEPESWGLETFEAELGDDNHWIKDGRMWFHLDDAQVILSYEGLNRELARLLGFRLRLPRIDDSSGRNGRHYREFYTDDTRGYVAERFAPEIERLGYAF